ncbi:MAG: universal stress protein [Armatimonadota bacterium]|nr:universal stress protein [Armatimonadota bacterium]MDR7486469.1 universal stress protein [Armatimonadota bacterium]MDR7532235.1 universal stress protein [Armatimonadota bacterium]MDR7537190.1 universal stress protein [Armatimonadota bacterium]
MRFAHLLVPLDGSRLAESALPAALALARWLGARVTLLHVLEPAAPASVHGDLHLRAREEALAYLATHARWLAAQGVSAQVHVDVAGAHAAPPGADVAASIAAEAAVQAADLIVLCTHGSGGLRGLLFGRVAQQVLARGRVPVLLVRPHPAGREHPFPCRRVLVALDGSDVAEGALPPAATLARAAGASLLLVWVVPTATTVPGDRGVAARLMPSAAAALLDDEADQASAYLARLVARLRIEGLDAHARVERGDPVPSLVAAATREGADLIVMTTHGRSGLAAVWAGSVASRLVTQSPLPVLLLRTPF